MARSPHLRRPTNPTEVRERVAFIAERAAADAKVAHFLEDQLYQDVLHTIAFGLCDDPAACASEALQTQNIQFRRA